MQSLLSKSSKNTASINKFRMLWKNQSQNKKEVHSHKKKKKNLVRNRNLLEVVHILDKVEAWVL